MTITTAFFIGDSVQIMDQTGPGTIESHLVAPGEDGYDDAVALAASFGSFIDPGLVPAAPLPTDPAALLEARRETTWLSKVEFLTRARAAQLLSTEDAVLAARGLIPAAFAPAIEAMSAVERAAAEIRWAAATQIYRLDPFIAKVAAGAGINDAALDALFGIEPAEEPAS